MPRKKKKERIRIGAEIRYGVFAVLLFALGVFFALAAFELGGPAGRATYRFLTSLVGIGYFVLPLLCLVFAASLLRALHKELLGPSKYIGALLFLLSGLGFVALIQDERAGIVGNLIAKPLVTFLDVYVTGIVFIALFIISILLMFDINLATVASRLLFWRKKDDEYEYDEDEEAYEPDIIGQEEYEEEEDEKPEKHRSEPAPEPSAAGFAPLLRKHSRISYSPPPLSLLEKDRGKPGAGDIKANANLIKRTLANFGVTVEIEEVTVGPSVTRYAIKPAEGVRLSKIVSLQNNLELALAAHPVRIEAPIPGRSLVGIEIPNTAKTTVGLGALLGTDVFKKAATPLYVMLGKTVSSESTGTNLAKLPHLLVAGATGSGKSVVIHSLITSLIYRNSPDELKFIMIDPKRVELTLWSDIPHLLTPVITAPKQAILALKWLITEMERRYDLLEKCRVRDISSYHANVLAPALTKANKKDDAELPEPLPYIAVIIDELADIMSTYPRELEAAIVRLAQMSRAVGIHLVLSTQRPSVNVITGLIKANIPGRLALQVSSQVDSRTILDATGAEQLLGAGDMLFTSGEMGKPLRMQGGFVTEAEVKRVAKYLRDNTDGDIEQLDLTEAKATVASAEAMDEEEDDLYEDARETVIEAGKASTSYLQRKLRVGYARAARLIDMLEADGIIGPADGAKPREVLTEGMESDIDADGEDGETNDEL